MTIYRPAMQRHPHRIVWYLAGLILCLGVIGGGALPLAYAQDDALQRAIEAQRQREAAEEAEEEERLKEIAQQAQTRTLARPGGTEIEPGRFRLPPVLPGVTPYNCLEWGFCRRDAWTQPVSGTPGSTATPITLRDMLSREGFGLTPVDCSTSTANHVIMLIWSVPNANLPIPPGTMPPDGFWVHAMKRLNGTWSSKNGQSYFYPSIPDPNAFVNRHYPPKPGHTNEIRCYAKP